MILWDSSASRTSFLVGVGGLGNKLVRVHLFALLFPLSTTVIVDLSLIFSYYAFSSFSFITPVNHLKQNRGSRVVVVITIVTESWRDSLQLS